MDATLCATLWMPPCVPPYDVTGQTTGQTIKHGENIMHKLHAMLCTACGGRR